METHEKSEIERLAEEKAKGVAKKEAGRLMLAIMTPLSILAAIAALYMPSTQGPLLSLILLVILVAGMLVANDTLYTRHYKAYLEELSRSKTERDSHGD